MDRIGNQFPRDAVKIYIFFFIIIASRQTSNIKRNLVGNTIVDRSDVIVVLDITPGFNGLTETTARRDEKHLSVWI